MAASLPPASRFEDRPDEWRSWLFAEMRSHFEDAAARKGTHSRNFEIGGKHVRMNFAGEEMSHTLSRALAHLNTTPAQNPELTICVWDSANHKPDSFLLKAYLAAVTHDWWEFVNPRGQLLDFHKPPFMAAYHPGSRVLSVLDLNTNVGLYWRNADHPLPYYEAGSPFRTMLHWWFRARSMQFVHAAAVGLDDRGVLLVGKGGSGKSTTGLVCLNAGMRYLGDDYCVVATDPKPTVHSLYNTCKLVGESDLNRFPGLAQRVWNRERTADDKATVFLEEHWPERLGKRARIQAILVPQVTGKRDTSLRPGTRMEALTALAPTTLAQLPSSDAQDLRTMKEIVHSAPVFVLELGTDLAQIPEVIQRVLTASPAEVLS